MPSLNVLLGLRVPVLSAPMAGIGGGRLAAAVSRAGGLGFIGGGYGERDWLQRELALCVETGARFGVGFITWALQRQPDLLALALAARPAAVLLSFGALGGFADAVHRAGAVLVGQVQTVAQARDAVAAGAQVIVAQGGEAGGHGGWRGTLALVPEVVDAVGAVPVVAAGGIADGRGLAAAWMLGAQGVLCGTVFYAADESLAHPAAQQRLLDASGDDTLKSSLFDQLRGLDWPPGPWSLRTLRNDGTWRWADDPAGLAADLPAQQAALRNARDRADFDIAPVIAGEAAGLVHRRRPAADIVADIAEQAAGLLAPARLPPP